VETHIEVRCLNVFYGQHQSLKDVNLALPKNQITVILGPSGCGKTTLLKCLNRFIDLADGVRISGQILVDGEEIHSPKMDVIELRKQIGLLAQRPFPLPMSIYENVAFGMRMHALCQGKAEMDRRVQHYLEEAGLWNEVKDRLHQPAAKLSIGQQQRLCLARGLAVEPEILLGDEITSALDPISAQHIEKRLISLKEHYSEIIVTHILRQAKRLADYVVFLYLGEVIECGPANQVFNHPRDELTRAYLEGQL
jgi:phosphate transport system ATP-binding protein